VALVKAELKALEDLKKRGDENGVENLRLIDRAEAQKIEPRVSCLAALSSPETGILDMAAYMRVMERVLKGSGVTVAKQCKVLSIDEQNT